MKASWNERPPAASQGWSRPPWTASAAIVLLVALGCATSARAQTGQTDPIWGDIERAHSAIHNWDYELANELIRGLRAQAPTHPGTLWAYGRYLHHQGEYDEAVSTLDEAIAAADDPGLIERIRRVRELAASTRDVVADYETHITRDGHFIIRYEPADEVLIPWAEETLESAYYELGYDFGYWPEEPVRVEIYPTASTLAAVSSLTEEAIKTSGTIGLCKYNRLMFTSPRATLRGYDWRNTMAHEYIHYLISRTAGAGVPIWLHEGLAKYHEERWRGGREMRLQPSSEDLLAERIEADDLVTFEEMHPSMALLPSQEDAATAFAEVFTVIEYVVRRRGTGAVREILQRIRAGDDAQRAFEEAIGDPFDVFERSWLAYLRNREQNRIPGEFREKIQFLATSPEDEATDELAGIDAVEARDYLHLGQLLRGREAYRASIAEYRKAETLLGPANPVLQNALARAHLDLGEHAEALEAVEKVAEWYPSFYRSWLHMGEALIGLDRHAEALVALEEAVSVNPFDPAIHEQMAAAFEELGEDEAARRAQEWARSVGDRRRE